MSRIIKFAFVLFAALVLTVGLWVTTSTLPSQGARINPTPMHMDCTLSVIQLTDNCVLHVPMPPIGEPARIDSLTLGRIDSERIDVRLQYSVLRRLPQNGPMEPLKQESFYWVYSTRRSVRMLTPVLDLDQSSVADVSLSEQ